MRHQGLIIVGLGIALLPALLCADDAVPAVKIQTSAGVPAAAPMPAAPAPSRRALNEIKGKLESKGDDPLTLRVMVEGGFNVEFRYGADTVLTNGGHPVQMEDLNYGDDLVVRYAGKELYALEVERVSKAAQP